MPDIFLSYNRNDQATARRFAEGFEREGFSVWWDQTLRSGEAYDKVTEKALEEAKAVVVLWSKTSVDSRWVRSEATQADRNGTLVPAMIEPCKRPIMFELTHTADLSRWKGDPTDAAWQAYVADVRQFVHKEVSAPQTARPIVGRKPKFSALHIAIAVTMLMLAGGTVFWALNRTPGATTSVTSPVKLAVLPFANPDGSEAGRVLAFGIAESVLHQLANLSELSVISWGSASAIESEAQDIREIAKQLDVAYVLKGSVQRNGEVLRVQARLVEAATERSVWSLRLDRNQKDVFSIQDEIAAQVTRALSVSVSPEGRERMRGQGTHNVEAYLAFLDGQDALSTWRTREAGIAASHFNRAVGLDPQFARALVMLVRARMRDVEHSSGPDQREQVAKALKELPALIERALTIDPRLGEAYVERGDLRVYDNLGAAERDYRKAIELTPSNARAYQQLAALLYDDPSRRREVAEPLQRARALDPLDPDLAVTWAVYQFYESGNAEDAESLLRQVLERNPQYLPAMVRRGEILLFGMGQFVEGIRVLEEALEVDPDLDYVRKLLVQGYIAGGDLDSARRLARQPGASETNQMFVDLAERRFDQAARISYEAIDAGTLVGTDQWAAVEAINQDARRTGHFSTAAAALDELLDIRWDSGMPILNRNRGLISDVFAYAGMLRTAGEKDRANALVDVASQAIELDEKERGGVNRWNNMGRARAAILKGDKATAQTNLEIACGRDVTCWYWLTFDPLFEPLRGTPRFQALVANLERRRAETLRALHNP